MRRTLAALLLVAATASAADNPLRLVPKEADFALCVESPRQLIDRVGGLEPLQALAKFSAVRESLESTNTRRARQFLAHYEKELGMPWPELLDKLAKYEDSFLALAAIYWKILVSNISEKSRLLPADDFLLVRYEDLVEDQP